MTTEPFFFETPDAARLFGVWRGAAAPPGGTVWVVCPPFAEEEKSAHRTLVELCEALRQDGEPSLLFAYRGTGDSSGDFATATLAQWRLDIGAACAEAGRRAPGCRLGLLGLRLGAALAAQVAKEVAAERLILLEPLLNGRQFIGAMSKRKSLRAMMTQQEAAQAATAPQSTPSTPAATRSTLDADAVEDFDGWGVGRAMRAELEALDLLTTPPQVDMPALIIQIGPREQLAAPLQKFAAALGAPARAVTMQPFWNLLDYVRADALTAEIINYRTDFNRDQAQAD